MDLNYHQGFMHIKPLVIQPIDTQGPADSQSAFNQNFEFPPSNPYGSHVPSGCVTVPNPTSISQSHTNIQPFIPVGDGENRLHEQPLPLQESSVHTGKAFEYSWHTFDGKKIPAITKEKFVAVKIIEQKILTFFPNTFPVQIRQKPPLRSIPMKPSEVKLFNTLNKRYKIGMTDFKERDVMVKLTDFSEFYEIIRLYYPCCVEDLKSSLTNEADLPRVGDTFGSGWVQINNTVLPYVKHGGNAFLPVDVIINAAKLPVDRSMTAVLPPKHYQTLNETCAILKKNIIFDETTEVLPLHILEQGTKGLIKFVKYLPSSDPKKHAKYIPEISDNKVGKKQDNISEMEIDVKKEQDTKPVFEQVSSSVLDNNSNTGHKMVSAEKETEINPIEQQAAKENVIPNCQNSETSTLQNMEHGQNANENGSVSIDKIACEGKSLQCLHRKDGTFVLMEALLRVFFPALSMEDFTDGVEVVLGANIPICTPQEEKAFLSIYRIPSESLKCKKLVTTHNLEQNLPILRRMFDVQFRHLSSAKRREEEVEPSKQAQSPKQLQPENEVPKDDTQESQSDVIDLT